MNLRKDSGDRPPQIDIAPSFYLFLSLVFALRIEGYLSGLFLMLSLHEAAHAGMVLLFHGKVRSIRITAFGLRMTTRGGLSRTEEALAILMGPLSNLAAAAVLYPIGQKMLASESLALGIYNLLPAKGLDGGTLVALIGGKRGETAASIVSSLLSAIWMALAFVLALRRENFLAPLLASWLMVLS